MSKKGKKKNQQKNQPKNRNQQKIAAKKAVVLGTEKKNNMPLLVATIGAVLIAGNQKLCSTSAESIVTFTGLFTGMTMSLAVTMPSSGYWNSHHH